MSVDLTNEEEDRLVQSNKSFDDVGRHVIYPSAALVWPRHGQLAPPPPPPPPPPLRPVETARVKAKGVGPLSGAAASQAAPRSRRAYRVGSL